VPHLQKFICGSLNMLADLMTVTRALEEGPQYKHVQGPLEKSYLLLCLFCHRRHSTLNLTRMVVPPLKGRFGNLAALGVNRRLDPGFTVPEQQLEDDAQSAGARQTPYRRIRPCCGARVARPAGRSVR
jgi:hypothetical protein